MDTSKYNPGSLPNSTSTPASRSISGVTARSSSDVIECNGVPARLSDDDKGWKQLANSADSGDVVNVTGAVKKLDATFSPDFLTTADQAVFTTSYFNGPNSLITNG